jgi:hypothetical protein
MKENKYNLIGNIMSNAFTSAFHGNVQFARNYLSTKATVQYKIGETQSQKLDFSAKLQDNSKGKLIREGVSITLQVRRTQALYSSKKIQLDNIRHNQCLEDLRFSRP